MLPVGGALALTLALGLAGVDARVQAAVDALAPQTEAVLVLDVATGRVLAQGGHPQRALPSGSTFKVVDVVAAGRRAPESLGRTVRCGGRAIQSGIEVRCRVQAAGHGEVGLEAALAGSCNIYFGALGEKVGTRALVDTARSLGVGLPPGGLPDDQQPAAAVADGRGVRVTARQLGELLRAVARGVVQDGSPLVDGGTLTRLRAGLRGAVEHGTATLAASSVAVAGKTGTDALGREELGWFAGYAPADAPTVVVVIARRGATGHETAALAPRVLDAFFHGAR